MRNSYIALLISILRNSSIHSMSWPLLIVAIHHLRLSLNSLITVSDHLGSGTLLVITIHHLILRLSGDSLIAVSDDLRWCVSLCLGGCSRDILSGYLTRTILNIPRFRHLITVLDVALRGLIDCLVLDGWVLRSGVVLSGCYWVSCLLIIRLVCLPLGVSNSFLCDHFAAWTVRCGILVNYILSLHILLGIILHL